MASQLICLSNFDQKNGTASTAEVQASSLGQCCKFYLPVLGFCLKLSKKNSIG